LEFSYYDDISTYDFFCSESSSDIENFSWISFDGIYMTFDPTIDNIGSHSFNFYTNEPSSFTSTINFTVCSEYFTPLATTATVAVFGSTTYTVDLLESPDDACSNITSPSYSISNLPSWITDDSNGVLTISDPPQDALDSPTTISITRNLNDGSATSPDITEVQISVTLDCSVFAD
jgi:hypothetical protein